jgi:homoserine kinase type II
MAVFTQLNTIDVQDFLYTNQFNIGEYVGLDGILGGIENTNYFLHTTQATYVLTIFERLSAAQLPFYLECMQHLAQHTICAPKPITNKNGYLFSMLKNKPACIVTKLNGCSITQTNILQIKALGVEVARMHCASSDFKCHQANLRSLDWWNAVSTDIMPFIQKDQVKKLMHELTIQNAFFSSDTYHALPKGICHCDLFRDNALFDNNTLSGIFDFYFAGIDAFLFDICVIINDWCIVKQSDDTLCLDINLYNCFLQAYQSIRPLTNAEHTALPIMLKAAALRFWISRLYDWYLPRNASLLKAHPPAHFEHILALHA